MSRFRIVLADDQTHEPLIEALREACPEAEIWQVKVLRPDADAFPKSPWLRDKDWKPDYLFRCDVLILDMRITCHEKYLPQDANYPWKNFGGEGFIQRFFSDWPGQAILMWTGHDDEKMPFADALTRKQLQDGWRGPHIAKYNKSNEDTLRMRESIKAMYDDFLSCGSLTDWDQIEFAASHDLPVLIVGESGTGKERVAWSIHRRWRTERLKATAELHIPVEPAVVNCAGLSEQLARSELFGCVKGSFTGADDHRVGKCLLACGVNVACLTATRRGKGEGDRKALEKLREYADLLAQAGDKTRPSDQNTRAVQLLAPTFGERYDMFQAMETVLRGVLNRAGKGSIDEYAELVRQAVGLLIDEEKSVGLDVVLKTVGGQPLGTLFLDEFGDLPPPVQALLLRYLQSFEVQPLGYPGFVRNARVRVIAATSDPAVAEMVGECLGGRVREIRKDDLREDLVFRVKGQVIRVQPVDESNLESELKREIEKHRGRNGVSWDTTRGGAIDYLVEELGKVLAANTEAAASGRTPPFAFGHRREIGRIVRLANAFVTGAADRGIKGLPQRVTREVVARLWRPSMLAASRQIADVSPSHSEAADDPHTNQFKCKFTNTIIETDTAKSAVANVATRVTTPAERTTPGDLQGNTAYKEAFMLTWFAAYYDEGGKDNWNHRAATLVFNYSGKSHQADASVKRVARTLFETSGRDAVSRIMKEAKRWQAWFRGIPQTRWPFKNTDVPPKAT